MTKGYLAGFADDQKMVMRRRRDGREKRASIKSATVVRDFYSFVGVDGHPNDEIETWMASEVEGPAMEALVAARSGAPPRGRAIETLARFVAISLLRTRTVRSYAAQADAHTRPLLVLTHALGRTGQRLTDLSPDALDRAWAAAVEVANKMSFDATFVEQSPLRTMLRKADEFSSTLRDWNWSLEQAAEGGLLTGDSPVATLANPDSKGWAGLLPPHSSVAMPVSPYYLLLASPNPLIGTNAPSSGLTERVNGEIVRHAFDAVYRHPSTTWPKNLTLSSQRPTLPPPTITLRNSEPGSTPTFPATYPTPTDTEIARLLDLLGAQRVVE